MMRFSGLFLLPLLPAFNTAAQKTFSQKDFNKLQQLAAPWVVQSNLDLPIYEAWKIVNDTCLTATLYRISEDSNYLPEASMALYYTNHKIKIDHAYLYENNRRGTVYIFKLKEIKKGVYYFENIADTFSSESSKDLKEIFCSSISYDLSRKDRIVAQRMYITPGKGLSTVRYLFKKD